MDWWNTWIHKHGTQHCKENYNLTEQIKMQHMTGTNWTPLSTFNKMAACLMQLSHRSAVGWDGVLKHHTAKTSQHHSRRHNSKTRERICYLQLDRASQARAKLLPLYFVFIPVCALVHTEWLFRTGWERCTAGKLCAKPLLQDGGGHGNIGQDGGAETCFCCQ